MSTPSSPPDRPTPPLDREAKRRLAVIRHVEEVTGNIAMTCRYFGISRHGLIALDWHNGNRSILVDHDLTGVIVGQTLATRPEDVYRALIEATAFSARLIVETWPNAALGGVGYQMRRSQLRRAEGIWAAGTG
jgi:ribulose kinase